MNSAKFTRRMQRWLILGGMALALAACDKKGESENDLEPSRTSSSSDQPAELTEQHGEATISWAISPGGDVSVLVKPDGKEPAKDTAGGALTVKPFGSTDAPKVVALTFKDGKLVADIGKLEADLTEVSYEIGGAGDTIKGVMHVPPGGTSQLLAGAKTAEKSGVDLSKPGPNGGILQVVGSDLVEVVGNKTDGELRVYVLDDDLKAVPVGERKLKVGLYGSPAEMVELKVSGDGGYFFGKLKHKANPLKVTLWLEHNHDVQVVVVHHHPGKVFHIGHQAHRPAIYVVHDWHGGHHGGNVVIHDDHDVHVHVKHKHFKHKHFKHKGHGKHGKPRVHISF